MDIRRCFYLQESTPELIEYIKTRSEFYLMDNTNKEILFLSLTKTAVGKISANEVAEYLNSNPGISTIRIYEKRPFHLDFPATLFRGQTAFHPASASNSVTILPSELTSKDNLRIILNARTIKAVDGLKKMLDCQDRSKIAKFPTYSYFEKFPQLMSKLFEVSGLDRDLVGESIGLSRGVVNNIISDPAADISKEVLRKFLTCFGLEQYLYRYRGNSLELQKELSASPHIREVVPAGSKTEERFKLTELKKGLEHQDNAWLYQLHLKSPQRDFVCTVVSPLGLIEGKEYEVKGLAPMVDQKENSDVVPSAAPSGNEIDEVIAKEKERAEKAARNYLDIRKDMVLRYFKIQNPEGRAIQMQEAEKHYRRLAKNDDLLDEFFWKHCFIQRVREQLEQDPEYLRRKENQPKDIRVKDYTAEKLQREFKLKAWESYFAMADLREAPRKTMERLNYRKTDPQYQH